MEKPITMLIEETKQQIVRVVNESKLPPFVLETIFRDLNAEIVNLARQQAEQERKQYEESLTVENTKKEDNKEKEE